jgi:HSP20 family protein
MKSLTRWDPFRMMRRWDPFEELRSMQHDMDRLFGRVLGAEVPTERTKLWIPSVEGYIKDNKLVFKAELPGVDPKDLDVSITDRELIIKGERKAEKGAREENYVYQEIAYGSFERRFVLPEGVKTEELKAKFLNGILEITVPAPAIVKARKIEIEAPKEEKKMIETEAKKAA